MSANSVWRTGERCAPSEVTRDSVDDRRGVLNSFAHVIDAHGERLVFALVPEIAECVELVEVRLDVQVVECGERVLARLRVGASPRVTRYPRERICAAIALRMAS